MRKIIIHIIDGIIWGDNYLRITNALLGYLADKLNIADVGAAGGVEGRWLPLEKHIRFICFEPDERSFEPSLKEDMVSFPVGLGERKEEREFYLASNPQASSLYPLNIGRLNDYANREAHKIVKTVKVKVDTLDNCLAQTPGIKLDLIKIDAEGAELEILKGARSSLGTIKGVHLETSFLERYMGAARFGEVDAYLHSLGFELFKLSREHWIRSNKLFGLNSNPQVIWADAVYFLGRVSFQKRLASLLAEERANEVIKYVILLLCYGLHDHAMEITQIVEKEQLVSSNVIVEMKKSIKRSIANTPLYLLRQICGLFFALIVFPFSLPVSSFRGKARAYLKKRLAYLTRSLYNMTRNGPYDACIHDL